ncbi:MAG: hypothetical protein ACYC42_10275 [Lysobacter sp.]
MNDTDSIHSSGATLSTASPTNRPLTIALASLASIVALVFSVLVFSVLVFSVLVFTVLVFIRPPCAARTTAARW